MGSGTGSSFMSKGFRAPVGQQNCPGVSVLSAAATERSSLEKLYMSKEVKTWPLKNFALGWIHVKGTLGDDEAQKGHYIGMKHKFLLHNFTNRQYSHRTWTTHQT